MNNKSIIGYSLAGLAILALFARKSSSVWDPITAERIKTLHPSIQPIITAFINKAASQGIYLRIVEAFRDNDTQNKYYAQGRTTPGSIITYARGGESFHNYGLSVDVVPVVNGKATYDYDFNKIGLIGKSLGLEWGGDFPTPDKGHFQKKFNNTIAMLQTKVATGKVYNGFPLLAA